MRRRLVAVTLAVTTLLVAAFAVPLAVLIRDVARDRALTDAERDLAALAPVVAVTTSDEELLTAAIDRTDAGGDGRLAMWLPGGARLGDQQPADTAGPDTAGTAGTAADAGEAASDAGEADAVALARERRVAFSRDVGGGVALYSPVVVGDGDVVVLRVRVPQDLTEQGVARAWTILAVLAVALLAVAVFATDRLARSVTRPAAGLARTSRALAGGDTTVRAEVSGPPEIADVAEAINLLADRIDELRAAERERVADLSHRLRTPLTALRLDAEASGSPALMADVDRLEDEINELIRAARRPLHAEVSVRCDLAEVAAERTAFWGALADDDGRRWTLRVDPPVASPVKLAATDAAAAIDVLIGNVFAHTPDGTPYDVAVLAADGHVRLVVDDAGGGIPDPSAVLDRGVSVSGSTGLGLDIAAATARAAGGTIHLGTSPAGGARVELVLPLASDRR
jgi:signal transduction histidine kinase